MKCKVYATDDGILAEGYAGGIRIEVFGQYPEIVGEECLRRVEALEKNLKALEERRIFGVNVEIHADHKTPRQYAYSHILMKASYDGVVKTAELAYVDLTEEDPELFRALLQAQAALLAVQARREASRRR